MTAAMHLAGLYMTLCDHPVAAKFLVWNAPVNPPNTTCAVGIVLRNISKIIGKIIMFPCRSFRVIKIKACFLHGFKQLLIYFIREQTHF